MKIDPDGYQPDYAALRLFYEKTQRGLPALQALLFAEAQQMLRMAVCNFCLLIRYLGRGDFGTAKYYTLDDGGYVSPYLDCGLELAATLPKTDYYVLRARDAAGEWRAADPPAQEDVKLHEQLIEHVDRLQRDAVDPALRDPLSLCRQEFARSPALKEVLECAVGLACVGDPETWCTPCRAREIELPRLMEMASRRAP